MADKKKIVNKSQMGKIITDNRQAALDNIALIDAESSSLSAIFDKKKRLLLLDEKKKLLQEANNNITDEYNKKLEEGYVISENAQEIYESQKKINENILKIYDKQLKTGEKKVKIWESISNFQQKIHGYALETHKFLMIDDKIIRTTTINLGMSAAKADILRSNFEAAAGFAARFGGSLEDIQAILQTYNDETGLAKTLTESILENTILIGRGTGLGVEAAGRLSAQYDLIGINSQSFLSRTNEALDKTENMGVSISKVLSKVSTNFKALQRLNFQQGVTGFTQMAMYSEKMKINMESALNSVEKAKTLEGAIELAAQLQIMGGEFAKTDPFQLLFLSRNDPAEFTKKINEMTRGVVSFRKTADGSFEKFISPADRDRLSFVEKSLGLQSGELIEQSLRMADIQKMRQQMLGTGLSKSEKELVEGIALFDSKTGKYQIELGGVMRDINTLNSNQITAFTKERESLDARAKYAQTFDEAFQSTINEFKSALLPMIRGVNKVLETFRPIVIKINDFVNNLSENNKPLLTIAGIFMTGAVMWSKIITPLGSFAKNLFNASTNMVNPPSVGGGGGNAAQTLAAGKGAGKAAMGKGIGTGAAALGIGAGIGVAALGVAELAKSMKDLDGTQIWALPATVTAIGVGGFLMAKGIGAIGVASTATAPGLLALGAVALGIGAGIGVATWGIGQMASGLGDLIDKSKNSGPAMLSVAGGMMGMSAALIGFNAGLLGLGTFSLLMSSISKNAPALATVGAAFKEINTTLSGNKDDFKEFESTIKSISSSNVGNLKLITELNKLLNKPLKVEFADKNVQLMNNITLSIDGEKLMEKQIKKIAVLQQSLREGKSG